MTIRAGVLTVSDRGARGERVDMSGPALVAWLSSHEVTIAETALVPDGILPIGEVLKNWADLISLDLILTTGGTGVSPRDVTPEATRQVLDMELPGFSEAMRAASLNKTPMAIISRAVAGIRKTTLIINLPGSPKGAVENLAVVWEAIPHAIEKIKGDSSDCSVLAGR